MKRFLLLLILIPSLALSQNPIIPGFHPDPSIVRVGEYYYIVNSSFQYFPGVPIHRSPDLRHWELIGNVLDRDSQLPLGSANSWQGIFAPTIRYNDGIYYMVTTNVSVGRNFFVTATDPAGPWSEPIWLDQGGIDPSFYFESGRCYLVSNPDNSITLCEIDPSSGRQLTPSKVIWRGTGGRYPEGPHIYHKDGWYYLLISEGGTEMAHSLTIARSRNIDGPYKPGPFNPILTHCSLAAQDSPIQGTGHGDFVQSPDGSWHVVFLAFRRFGGDYHHLGRETFIAPVTWLSGWPVINDGHPIALDLTATSAPAVQASSPDGTASNSALASASTPDSAPAGVPAIALPFTGPEWVHIQNPERDNYTRIGSALVLRGNGSSLTTGQHPTYLGRRQEGPDICLDATLTALTDSTVAGITVYQIDGGHLDLGFESDTTLTLRYQLKSINHLAASRPLHPTTSFGTSFPQASSCSPSLLTSSPASTPHDASPSASSSASTSTDSSYSALLNAHPSNGTSLVTFSSASTLSPGANGVSPAGDRITTIYLRITSDGLRYWFYRSPDGVEYEELGSVETSLVSTEVVGGFTGVTLGMYCTRGLAAFTRFDLR